MDPFLLQVARHYFSAGGLERLCFIFPNRRAEVFFRKYLGELVRDSGQPMMSPAVCTMNDFFYGAAGVGEADQISLLLELYDCYCALNPQHESLDDFIFWGGVLLSDFNDVDKYLVKAESLFANISDLRKMQDSYEYLEPQQEEAIRRFVSHFRTGGRYKDEFRKIWDILLPLYRAFNQRLRDAGLAYEGQVYRSLAERLSGESVVDILAERFQRVDKYVFVGLNALNECEKRLMRKMRDASIAEFCWDYSSSMIRDPNNKSSFFMADNVLEFPQAFIPDEDKPLGLPHINVLSIPSSVGQAAQLPQILSRLGAGGIETAVVLPDESLLLPVLNSIPEHIKDINVTMGYPMRGSGLWSLMNEISALQMHIRQKAGEWHFYHKQVWAIFSNSVFKSVLSEQGRKTVADIRKAARYYIPQADFSGDPVLGLIFRPVVTSPGLADASQIESIGIYQREVLSGIAPLLKEVPDMALELDFAAEYYRAVGRLARRPLPVLPQTWFRLLDRMVGSAAVPFKGEPLKGLQIMGPLETRALDFDNIIILSCNEGVFPRRSVSSSFIPAELRRGFGLPSYEYQDAVWAYYFYRMIQRSGHVWMLMDSRTEGTRSGEESRYIKQLEMHFGLEVRRHVAKAPIEKNIEPDSIPKTEDDIRTLRTCRRLSASALQNYLSCPAKFYYHSVKGLKAKEEVSETLDSGMVGSVFHEAMQTLYSLPSGRLDRPYLRNLLKGDAVSTTVHGLIMKQLNSFEVTGRNLIFEDMICRYVRKTVESDLELLDNMSSDHISILGLELKRTAEIGGFRFVGYIDRLDSITQGEVRIVDYKTGKVTDNDFIITEDNAGEVVDLLFGPDNEKRPKIALQLYLYDRFVSSDPAFAGNSLVNSIYQTSRMFIKSVENVRLNDTFNALMEERLGALLEEIADCSVPFRRTADAKTCGYCDFKSICGR